MSTRRRWAFAGMVALSSGGCAVIAGYDFGKYTEAGGTGGEGGRGASSSSASVSSSGDATVSTSASSSSSGGKTTSTSSGPSLTTSSTSSGGVGGAGGAGGVTELVKGLAHPEAITFDTVNVYFTTNAQGSSAAGYVSKTVTQPTSPTLPVTMAFGAPAIVSPGSGAYAAVTTETTTLQGNVDRLSGSSVMPLVTVSSTPSVAMEGIAVGAANVYFTTSDTRIWVLLTGMTEAMTFGQNFTAQGAIAADDAGVYWPSPSNQMMRAALGGGPATPLAMGLSAQVYAVTTDAYSVYWTDAGGGVYLVSKAASNATPTPVCAPDINPPAPAYGIAVDDTGAVYFARGSEVYRVTPPSMAPTPVTTGLFAPHGIALDGNDLYVADAGNGSTLGRIMKFSLLPTPP